MTITLHNGKTIILNSQQIEALGMMKQYLDNKLIVQSSKGNHLLFCLEGFAGTGKTTIIKEVLDWYENTIGRWAGKVAVTAPTHQAKRELSNATGMEGKTIQSLIGLAPNVEVTNFDVNNPEFALLNKPTIDNYSLVVIDESSMLNTDLFTSLVQQAERYNTKIIFMCDSAQLPPVNEEISPVVISNLIGFRYKLTKVERQAGDNPLMLVYDKIRDADNLTKITDSFEHKTNLIELPKPPFEGRTDDDDMYSLDERMDAWNAIKPVYIGIEFLNSLQTFGSRVVSAFVSPKFQEDSKHCKLFAWTNERVKFWNEQIRNTLIHRRRKDVDPLMLGDMIHDQFVMPGELLLGYVSYNNGIQNACQYRVMEINYDIEYLDYGPYEDIIEVELMVYRVTLQDVNRDDIAPFECCIIEPDPKNYQSFVTVFNYYLSLGKEKMQWSRYYGWKSKYMLISDIRADNGMLIAKKDMDYGYALSVHKSQGSTYDQVFVDEDNIDKLESRAFVQYLMKSDIEKLKRMKKKLPKGLEKFNQKYPNFDVYYQQQQIVKNKLKYVSLSRPRFKATVLSIKSIEP